MTVVTILGAAGWRGGGEGVEGENERMGSVSQWMLWSKPSLVDGPADAFLWPTAGHLFLTLKCLVRVAGIR